MSMNPILKYGGIVFVILVVLMLLQSCGDNVRDVDIQEPPNEGESSSYNGVTGSAAEELRTLSVRLQAQEAKFASQNQTISDLKNQLDEAKQSNQGTSDSGLAPQEFDDRLKELEAAQDNNNLNVPTFSEAEREQLIQEVLERSTDVVGAAKDYATGNLDNSKNPLLGNKNNGDYVINGKKADNFDGASSNTIIWSAPLDAPGFVDQGVVVADVLSESINSALTDSMESAKDGINDTKNKITSLPVFTIPANTTMFGAKTTGRVIARIPSGGSVKNPYGFKLIVPGKNIAANGHEIEEVSHAFMSGFAVGDLGLKCARGYITNMTFVFEDGRISQIGDPLSTSTSGEGLLAIMTGLAGAECVKGELKTDFPEYLTTTSILGGITAAAEAAAAAQQTTTTTPSGEGTSTLTGSQGVAIAGGTVAGATETTQEWVNDRWKESFDAILVEIGVDVQIETKAEIAIDYDSQRRKTVHRTQQEAIAQLGEEDIVWN